MNDGKAKQPYLQGNNAIKSPTFPHPDPLSSSLLAIASALVGRKYADAFAESARLKLPAFVELSKMAYQYAHLRYLLTSKDKILQVNTEPHLLTQGGMGHLRSLALFRQQANQAKANYQAIADNIKKLLTSNNYYQCTLPNRQEMQEVKSALSAVFQELKALRKQKPLNTSQATERERAKVETTINECKEGLLEIISLIVPTLTMKKSTNRQKTIVQLIALSKELLKEVVSGYKNEMELLQSRTMISEKTLENERNIKLERERQIKELNVELYASQRIIEDLEGMNAVTEMENLGLHSKIKTSGSDEEREMFEAEIERLRLEVEEMTVKAVQAAEMERRWREELSICEHELEREREERVEGLGKTCQALEEENTALKKQIADFTQRKKELEQIISQQQSDLRQHQQLSSQSAQKLQQLSFQASTLKSQKEQCLAQLQKLQSSQQTNQEMAEELHKLQEDFDQLQAENTRLHTYLQTQQQKRSAYESLIEELSKLNEECENEKGRLGEQLQGYVSAIEGYRDTVMLLESKLKELQEEYEYLMAEKDYYASNFHARSSLPSSQDHSIHT